MTGNTGVTPEERYEHLILSVAGIDDPESDTFMRGFAYGRFTKLDSELARHWGVGRGFAVDACPVVDEPANLLSVSSPNHADTGLWEGPAYEYGVTWGPVSAVELAVEAFEAEAARIAEERGAKLAGPSLADADPEFHADFNRCMSAALASIPDLERMGDDPDEAYEIGKRDGYEQAVQDLDLLTGGDGEYRYCTNHDPDRHCPDADTMKARIVERFESSERMDAWRPIETAPRDGSPIIAWWSHLDHPVIAWFGQTGNVKGKWVASHSTAYRVGMSIDPTHWQPLPATPRKAFSGDKA